MGLDNDFLKTYIRASEIANQTLKAPNERRNSEKSQVEESPGFQVTCIYFLHSWEGSDDHVHKAASSTIVTLGSQPLELHQEAPSEIADEGTDSGSIRHWQNLLQSEGASPGNVSSSVSYLAGSAAEAMYVRSQTQMNNEIGEQSPAAETAGGTCMELSENTTLCTLAFSLVLTNNLKGYTADYLDAKMRSGYICGSNPSEGCRISNKVLFSVLAEIS